jgi:hypothetical protein
LLVQKIPARGMSAKCPLFHSDLGAKVTKQKDTPHRLFPALLVKAGGCGTRAFSAQTVLAENSRFGCDARRDSRGFKVNTMRMPLLLPLARERERVGERGDVSCLKWIPALRAFALQNACLNHFAGMTVVVFWVYYPLAPRRATQSRRELSARTV